VTQERQWRTAFLERLTSELERLGPVPLVETKGILEVSAAGESGFVVRAAVADDGIEVGYDGWHWHEEFESDLEALNCFLSGVFGESRLAVSVRCGFAHSWTAEVLMDGSWVSLSTTGYFLFPFWCRRQVRYLRNDRSPRTPGD
jgi:hypothetical protein